MERGSIEKPNSTPKIWLENTRLKKQVEVLGKILEAQYHVDDNFLLQQAFDIGSIFI